MRGGEMSDADSLRALARWLRRRAEVEEQIASNYLKADNEMWEVKAANADRYDRAARCVDELADMQDAT